MKEEEFDRCLRSAFDAYAKNQYRSAQLKTTKSRHQTPPRTGFRGKKVGFWIFASALLSALLSVGLICTISFANRSKHSNEMKKDRPFAEYVSGFDGDADKYNQSTDEEQSTDTGKDDFLDGNNDGVFTDGIVNWSPFLSGTVYTDTAAWFADPVLVDETLTDLTDQSSYSKRFWLSNAESETNSLSVGKAGFYFGYEQEVTPIAIRLTFGSESNLIQSCSLSALDGEGNWQELLTYSGNSVGNSGTVCFYVGFSGDDHLLTETYSDFCLIFSYYGVSADEFDLPDYKLYGLDQEAASDFIWAGYLVSDQTLYRVITNATQLTVPDSFAGRQLKKISSDAFSASDTENLLAIFLPDSVEMSQMVDDNLKISYYSTAKS